MSTYLTAKEAAHFVRTSYRGFDQFARRHGIPCERYGRKRLFKKDTLERVLKTMSRRLA